MTFEHAWAAGFFEGEGYVGFVNNGWRMAISNVEVDLLRRFGQAVDAGNVRLRNLAKQATHRDVFIWRLTAKDEVLRVATVLLPYMQGEKVKRMNQVVAAGPRIRITSQKAVVGFLDHTV